MTSLEKAPRPLGWVRAPRLPLLCPLPTPQVLWLPLPSPTDHMLAKGWPIHPPQRRAQEGLQSGVGGPAGPEHQGGGFGPVHPMELILLNKCSKVHNTCYFHKGTHPCNYHPDQETHLSAPQKCPNLKSLGDLSASVDPDLPPRLPLQPAKPQISHLDAKGLNQDRKFFPPLCQRVKGTGESVAGKYSWRRWHSLGRPWKVSSVRAGRQRLRGAGSCTNIHPRRHERHLLILSVNS